MKNRLIRGALALLIALTALHAEEAEPVDGEALYHGAAACFTCHQPDGTGLANAVPPLTAGSWVSGPNSKERMINIILHGLTGPIRVNRLEFNSAMPPHAQLSDEEVAAVATYVRRSFGNRGSAVSTEEVAAVRAADYAPEQPWTTEQLLERFPMNAQSLKANGLPISKKESLDAFAMREIEEITVTRTWLDGATPAAIAVAHPGPQYLVWDAGTCGLRYAWNDRGFLHDIREHWSSNGKPVARVEGTAYLATNTDRPIQIGDKTETAVDFRGYRLHDGNPHFLYRLDDVQVEEWFTTTADRKGIVWHAIVQQPDGQAEPVHFLLGPTPIVATSPSGAAKDGRLSVSAMAAKSGVAITILPGELLQ